MKKFEFYSKMDTEITKQFCQDQKNVFKKVFPQFQIRLFAPKIVLVDKGGRGGFSRFMHPRTITHVLR